jgi:hypothetical protein
MKIINQSVVQDIKDGRPLRLNLGSGPITKKGLYNLDILEMEGVDIVADLNKPLDGLPDNSVVEIYSSHTFEHISNFLGLMAELYRIVMPNGRIETVVPHFSNPIGYSDPTHVRFFGLYTMYYFADRRYQMRCPVPTHYSKIRFQIHSVRIKFARVGLDRWFGSFVEKIVNINNRTKALFERHFCWHWPASELVYVMSPDKQILLEKNA